MEFVKYTESEKEAWDGFCFRHSQGWFWHTTQRMDHALNRLFDAEVCNKSFMLIDRRQVLGIVPLTINEVRHNDVNIREINYGGWGTPLPLLKESMSESQKKKLYGDVFSEINRIAMEEHVARSYFAYFLTYEYCKRNTYYNFLLEFGFTDMSLNTHVLDLELEEEELIRNLSDNHLRAIRKGQKYLEIKLFDSSNITREVFDRFTEFYFRIAGKITRPKTVYELMYYQLTHGMAVMGVASFENKEVGYVIVIKYKHSAYYLNGANENNFTFCPIAHGIHWEIIKYLKGNGYKDYELGVQQFGPLLYDYPSEKDINISRFKRGFGGVIIPRFAAEKVYTKDYARSLYSKRIEKYLKHREDFY